MSGLYLLAACIAFSAAASFFLKLGSAALSGSPQLTALVSNPILWLGGIFYAAAFIGYIYLLKIFPLSLAQPAITAGVSVVTAVVAVIFLREQMATVNWIGLLLICLGVLMLFWGRN